MKVSSPVGEFPFTISGVHLARDGLVVRGQMGRWPASIVVDPHDLLRSLRYGAIAIAGASLLAGLAVRRPRGRKADRGAAR